MIKRLIILAACSLFMIGCGSESREASDTAPIKSANAKASAVDEGCTQQIELPAYENGKAYEAGGFICTMRVSESRECDVLYSQAVVPEQTRYHHRGWNGSKLRYIPSGVIECRESAPPA